MPLRQHSHSKQKLIGENRAILAVMDAIDRISDVVEIPCDTTQFHCARILSQPLQHFSARIGDQTAVAVGMLGKAQGFHLARRSVEKVPHLFVLLNFFDSDHRSVILQIRGKTVLRGEFHIGFRVGPVCPISISLSWP
jgi:hypothetical protein